MKKIGHLLFGLGMFLIGIFFVSAYSQNTNSYNYYESNKQSNEHRHYSDENCNMPSHYIDEVHIHDTENCTISYHNHNSSQQVHYSEPNCNVSSHYTNGVHYHNVDNCTNANHNHHSNYNSSSNSGHHKSGCHK